MDKKLKMIMLVDDDVNTNIYNEFVIKRMNICEQIKIFQNGKLGLEFLSSKNEDGQYPCPELIFLDINMPIMNGWEFIELYDKLEKAQQAKILIAMLTSSMNYEDKDRAMKTCVKAFINKPLIEEKIKEIIGKI